MRSGCLVGRETVDRIVLLSHAGSPSGRHRLGSVLDYVRLSSSVYFLKDLADHLSCFSHSVSSSSSSTSHHISFSNLLSSKVL